MKDLARNAEFESVIGGPPIQGDKIELPTISAEQSYDELAMSYLLIRIHQLNTVLKSEKQMDFQQRKRIVGAFFSAYARFFDAGCMRDTSGLGPDCTAYPLLTFAERGFDTDEGLGAIDRMLVPHEMTCLDEYIGGVVEQYYTEFKECIDEIKYFMI